MPRSVRERDNRYGVRAVSSPYSEKIAALLRGEVDAIYSDAAMGEIVKAAFGLVTVVDLTALGGDWQCFHGAAAGADGDGQSGRAAAGSGGSLDLAIAGCERWAREHNARVLQIIAQDTGCRRISCTPRTRRAFIGSSMFL